MKVFLLALITVASFALNVSAEIINFQIPQGTNKGAWNTKDTPIRGKVGDTIRFYNNDTIIHRLHTGGAPCGHGPQVMPNAVWDCEATHAYDANAQGALYDHNFGPEAQVWILISN